MTFLFTDVEGSTGLWARDADAMSASLRVHDAVVRRAIEAHAGYVFTTAGDAFCAAFGRASDAVAAASAAQRALAQQAWPGPEIRVRMGLPLGEAEERGGDYFGPVVNTAARVEATAHGGQVVAADHHSSTWAQVHITHGVARWAEGDATVLEEEFADLGRLMANLVRHDPAYLAYTNFVLALVRLAADDTDAGADAVHRHAVDAASGRLPMLDTDALVLLAELARCEGDLDRARELMLQTGTGRTSFSILAGHQVAQRLGVHDQVRHAFSENLFDPDWLVERPRRALRAELDRRGWSEG